ncbi:MAG TPA: ABC transporter permease, partial [Bdellovibrionales bacterium]|nr:ABC transporter permease [Bdellovibrionales bacterium]
MRADGKSNTLIELSGVSRTYRVGETTVHALRDVSLTIEAGDFVAIMGPSGSGKSTLSYIIGLLDTPTAGTYRLAGKNVSSLASDELAAARLKDVGYVFQQFNLLPNLSAKENVGLPLMYSGAADRPLAGRHCEELLAQVGLGHRVEHRPNELSGGQQQRVAIARALANAPRLLVADEPTGNLDSASEKEVLELFSRLNERGLTVVMITHEEEIASRAKRVIRMRDGVIHSDTRLRPVPPAPAPAAARSGPDHASQWPQMLAYFTQGFKTLRNNKVRTALSVLGVMIGVASIIATLALGRGAQDSIQQQMIAMGSNIMRLYAGPRKAATDSTDPEMGVPRLRLTDADALVRHVPEIEATAPWLARYGHVSFRNATHRVRIVGVDGQFQNIHSVKIENGSFFAAEDNLKRVKHALVSSALADELLGGRSPLGESIRINKIGFHVVGVVPETSGISTMLGTDKFVLVPLATGMRRLFGSSFVDVISLRLKDPGNLEAVKASVLNFMTERHRMPASNGYAPFSIRAAADVRAALASSN